MLARLIAFHGEIPEPTRNDQSNLSMINAITMLRETHSEFDNISKAVKKMLGDPEHSHKIIALLSRSYYRGLNSETGACYTDVDRIKRIGYAPLNLTGDAEEDEITWIQSKKRYRKRIKEAYSALERIL
jgi:hypothetical protein